MRNNFSEVSGIRNGKHPGKLLSGNRNNTLIHEENSGLGKGTITKYSCMGLVKKLIHEENSGVGKGTIPEKSWLGTGILNGLQRFPKHSGLE